MSHPFLITLLLVAAGVGHGQNVPASERLQITDGNGAYVLSVPVSSLIMTIPKGGLAPQQGGSTSPRYFYFREKGTSLIISGWFESAQRFRGVKELWAEQAAANKQHKLPEPQNVAFDRVGNWEVVSYDMNVQGAHDSTIRAEWAEAGTWIDLHLSITSTEPVANLQAKLRNRLQGIQVTVKAQGSSRIP